MKWTSKAWMGRPLKVDIWRIVQGARYRRSPPAALTDCGLIKTGGSMKQMLRWALLAVTLTALAAGGIAWAAGAKDAADACWVAGTLAAIVPSGWWVISGLRGPAGFGVDVLAVLSLVGALAVREYLAGALIAVMLATGQALDAAAERRATKDLRALLDRVPRTARRFGR